MVKQLLFLTLMISALPAMAAVTASVDRTELYDDESLLLTVRIEPAAELNQQDIEALESLFEIRREARSDSRRSVNGRATSAREYQFLLSPRQVGALGIPNFRVAGAQSQPIIIKVLDASQRRDGLAEDAILFTASLSETSPYVKQPIVLTLEVAYKAQLRNTSLADIETPGFTTKVLDETQATEQINGQTYNVYRRIIELLPESAGLYALPEMRLNGEYADTSRGRFMRFTRRASVPAIEVLAVPADYPADAYWLPLQSLTLSDNLAASQTLNQFAYQDWEITAQVSGQPATLLPDVLAGLIPTLDPSIKIYRNPAQIEGATRLDSAALAFTEAGQYQLPMVRIPWWNLNTNSLAWAELPARSFSIAAAASPMSEAIAPAAETPTAGMLNPATEQRSARFWPWLSLISLLGWAITALLWWRAHHRVVGKRLIGTAKPQPPSPNAYLAYLAWVRSVSNKKEAIEARLNAAEQTELAQLELRCAQATADAEDLQRLEQLTAKLTKRAEARDKNMPFSLYPA